MEPLPLSTQVNVLCRHGIKKTIGEADSEGTERPKGRSRISGKAFPRGSCEVGFAVDIDIDIDVYICHWSREGNHRARCIRTDLWLGQSVEDSVCVSGRDKVISGPINVRTADVFPGRHPANCPPAPLLALAGQHRNLVRNLVRNIGRFPCIPAALLMTNGQQFSKAHALRKPHLNIRQSILRT